MAVRRVVKQVPDKSKLYSYVNAVMEEHYTGCQHSKPFVVNSWLHEVV
jgi:hypothetical protein